MRTCAEFEKSLEEYDRLDPMEYRKDSWRFCFISRLLIEILRELRSKETTQVPEVKPGE